ncbi:hypothetical protein [Maridesulfovibrio bastinii]|uniref:hypothetical protein n=1 Tax=Maridesulfovibrio bastinii TaxID=47157 RepID=UPI001FE1DA51|nr:hypothetical protein [Maridesulfovibrio bastinii]
MAGKADLQTGQAWACDYPLRPSRLGRFVSLDGSRRLGTAWRIGQVVAPWALDGRRRLGGNGLCSQAAMHPTLRAATPLATHRMGSTQRLDGRYWRLNGLRRLGRVARLNENLHLDGDRWLGLDRYAPRLGKLYHPLDGSWRVGATGCSLDGTWRIGESIAAETTFATIQ